jgi:streptogramin lyase
MYSHADAIDEINITTGAVISYPAPSGATPYQLVTGPDGNVWFTDESNNAIGMVDLSQTTSWTTAAFRAPGRRGPEPPGQLRSLATPS